MMIYISDLQVLEQSQGNSRLRAIVDDAVLGVRSVCNTDLIISNVLERVRHEGHIFYILSNGRRLTATEDESRSKVGQYVRAALDTLEPEQREATEVEEAVTEIEAADHDGSFDWLAGVEGLDELEEMVLDDESFSMDLGGTVDVVDHLVSLDDKLGDDEFVVEDLDVLGGLLLDEPLTDDDFQRLLRD